MGNFFGVRRRAPRVTAQDRAILQLKQQRDKIKIYQKKTDADLIRNKELAIQLYKNGFKERALVALRRKKCMEDILNRTDKQLSTLEQLVHDIEFTQIEVSVVEGLKVGTEALKQLTSLMDIDDIQQMMDDSAEAAEKQKEIAAILEQSTIRYDEEDLVNELNAYTEVKEKEEEPKPAVIEEAPTEIPFQTAVQDQANTEPTIGAKLDDLPVVPDVIQTEQEDPESEKKVSRKEKQRQLEPAQ